MADVPAASVRPAVLVPPATATPCGAPARVLQVLLLEDSRFDAELIRARLSTACPGAQLRVVGTEADFLVALRDPQLRHDLLLSDYELPGFTGAQALQHAQVLAPGVPFIFVSGVIGEDNAVEMMKKGATDYVSKSRLERLPVVVDRALREVADRDARARAERRLREADARYAQVVDALRDYAVLLTDNEGRVREWNAGARELFGRDLAEVAGRPDALLFTPEDVAAGVPQAERERARREGRSVDERWLLRGDGARRRAESVVMPLADGSGFCRIVRDTTESHEQARRLRDAKEQAERASEAKDRFLAMLSHELRTPLSPIAAAVRLLEETTTLPDHLVHLLPMIRRNVALEARLIDDLLDLTSITAGKLVLRREPVDVHELLVAVVEILREDLQRKRLSVALDPGAAASRLAGDGARLQQALWNLVRNAIKFSPDGEVIELATRNEGDTLVVACRDHGIGIPRESMPHLFTPFRQGGGDVARRFGGLGLGLAIARGLAREHGGDIRAESDGPGQGACFTLRLPLPVGGTGEAGRAAAGAPTAPMRPGAHLLLVEDNVDAGESMRMALEFQGWRVTLAGSLGEARRALAAERPDVVLTDLGLPDGSGIALGAELGRSLPVIALSGYGSPQDHAASRRAGFAGHLVKPADPDEVDALLRQVLAARAKA